MKTAKLGALFLVSVLALASVGAGYALWSDTLYIDGTVETGTVSIEWSPGNCYDDEPDGKNVSGVTATIEGNTMTILVTNAYPCINYTVEFDIHNNGTIPVHLGPWEEISNTLPPLTNFNITDFECTQLDPSNRVYGNLTIHLKNDAEQGTTYAFALLITASQWNEA